VRYGSINRRTDRFYVFYDGGVTIINGKTSDGYRLVVRNHNAQTGFLDKVSGRYLTDAQLDRECDEFYRKLCCRWEDERSKAP